MKQKKFAILLAAVLLSLNFVGCRMIDTSPNTRNRDVTPNRDMPGENDILPDIRLPDNTVPNNGLNNGTNNGTRNNSGTGTGTRNNNGTNNGTRNNSGTGTGRSNGGDATGR